VLWLWSALAWAGPPTLVLTYRGDSGRLTVEAAGEHVNEEGPVRGWVQSAERRVEFDTSGAALADGLLVDLPDAHLQGSLSFSLCADGGTACRTIETSFAGRAAGRKGRVVLGTEPREAAVHARIYVPRKDDVGAALARAGALDKLVLLEVGAVWCPPCNLLAAEVFDNPAHRDTLAPFVLAQVDADDPSSFAVKDRYDVRGYPTLLVLRPDGTEVDRVVGYWAEEDAVAWIARAATALPFGALPPAQSMTPQDAAELAVRIASSLDAERAKPYLDRAAAADTTELHLARFLLAPSAAGGELLAERDVPGWDWVFAGLETAKQSPELADTLRAVARRRLAAQGTSVDVSQSFQVLAALADDADAPDLFLAAARALEAGFSGEPDRDRGRYGELADLYEQGGAPERARAILTDAIARYPDEFTFHYQLARHLFDRGLFADALLSAQAAFDHSYGDNRLRAAKTLAQTLHAVGRDPEAVAVLDRALAEAPRPEANQKVRTFRYLQALEEARAEITKSTPSK
jgi:thioredoxin-like negative regulator of GroEL